MSTLVQTPNYFSSTSASSTPAPASITRTPASTPTSASQNGKNKLATYLLESDSNKKSSVQNSSPSNNITTKKVSKKKSSSFITKPWKYHDPNRKKTPVYKFFLKQKKSKKPTLLSDSYLNNLKTNSDCNLIRYGQFNGMKDERCLRCNVNSSFDIHSIYHLTNGIRCHCRFTPFVQSPLSKSVIIPQQQPQSQSQSQPPLLDFEDEFSLDDRISELDCQLDSYNNISKYTSALACDTLSHTRRRDSYNTLLLDDCSKFDNEEQYQLQSLWLWRRSN
ncbi:hypothetical protein TBLA_0I01060 [Henningerozyma blattae CBS 6284]|uniref:Uncharacterized protein n=1 Tax=Henningerozyma blattae (strain ATCC 34711 / CBS 6284 / DSM 70876 / NBRC 10599 / NRRL Y-10934 / UCD 77-7) TaxID=1071380 RepID=I2H8R3_HENB6|nr:hypothetical protein TBLA_0I01060 [Tetrapisispora blattae CBS 6284]CCH62765.1 hypothetical protein TBLA_0I01060 [Tetrapisispora blattae CBS 6284]